MANFVEAKDEFAPFRGRGDAFRGATAHRGNDVYPGAAIRVAEEHGIDAIFFGHLQWVLHVVLGREQVAAGEVLRGVPVLVHHFVVVSGDRDMLTGSRDGEEPLCACAREDGADVDVRMPV